MKSRCEWMKGSVGVSFHWTTHSAAYPSGEKGSYEDAVNSFDVGRFTSDLVDAGAKHCTFTLTHAEQYLAFPNETLEALLPGRTTKRDLIGEIAQSLNDNGIRFIAYYNHSCNGGDDVVWKKACGYDAGIRGNLDLFADNICAIVGETAKRYGSLLSGWWFDSPYSVDPRGPHNSISCDMGDWLFPWQKLMDAARSGNPYCAVCINAGIGENFQYAEGQDYCAGETVRIDEKFPPVPFPGLIDHRWITIDNADWVYHRGGEFAQPRFSDDAVHAFIEDNKANDRLTTFNMEIDRTGRINPNSLAQFARVTK